MQVINGNVDGDVAARDVVKHYYGQRDWMQAPLSELYLWRRKFRGALRWRQTVTYTTKIGAFLLLVLIPSVVLFAYQSDVRAAFTGTAMEPWWQPAYAAATLLLAYFVRRRVGPASGAVRYYRQELAKIDRAIVIQRDLSRF